MTKESIGQKLRRIRKLKGISQESLAERAGLKRAHISHIENDKYKSITLDTAKALAKGLDVRPEIFLTDKRVEGIFLSIPVFEGFIEELQSTYTIFNNISNM